MCIRDRPMTAADVVFSYELFRDKGIAEYLSLIHI